MLAAIRTSDFLRHRVAVSTTFLLNGFVVGAWAPAIPIFKDKHSLSESELGLMILAIGIGSLVTMPITGALIARRGSTDVLKIASWACTIFLSLALLAPTLSLAIAALLAFGGGLGSMDVAMNANAARAENIHDRTIMSSCHGFWSLGAFMGVVLGGTLIGLVGLAGHAIGISIVMIIVTALALPFLLKDEVERGEGIEKPKLSLPRSLAIYLIALTAFAGFTAEGTVLDWAALYLRDEREVPAWMAGYAFAAFSAMMALVRFAGDPVRTRLGDLLTFRLCAVIATIGFLIAGLSPFLIGSLIGFAIAGLGLANIVPIAFATADRIPGIPRGIGISMATFFGYAGILVAPPLIGFAAEEISYSTIFACAAILPLYCLAVASVFKRA